jgi:uncharacterized protein
MHVPSKFNYSSTKSDGGLLIYNSYTGMISKVSSENKETYFKWIAGGISEKSDPAFEKLVEKGYFIEESEDEDQKALLAYSKILREQSLHLIILPTEQCNFRCQYCYEDFKRGKMSSDLQDALIKYVRRSMPGYSSLRVSWFGGEPLMAFDVIEHLSTEFLKICKALKRPYSADMTTNAYLMHLDSFKKLLQWNVLQYQVTLDGTEKTHNRQRPLANGGESFDKIIKNLSDIKNNVKTGRFQIMIRTNFTNDMEDSISEYVDYYDKLFGDDVRFSFFVRTAGNWGGDRVNGISGKLISDEGESRLFDAFARLGKTLNLTSHQDFIMPLGSVCYACTAGSIVVDSEGSIRRCTCSLDDDDVNKIGYLGLDGRLFIDAYKASRWIPRMPENPKCKSCFFLPGCFANSCPKHGIYTGGEVCPHEKCSIDSVLAILDKCNDYEMIF